MCPSSLLFNIFINDIFFFTEHYNSYNQADDNVISCAGNMEINKLMDWVSVIPLQLIHLNFKPWCYPQHIRTAMTSTSKLLILVDTVVNSTDKMKVLGVTKDAKLSSNDQTTENN